MATATTGLQTLQGCFHYQKWMVLQFPPSPVLINFRKEAAKHRNNTSFQSCNVFEITTGLRTLHHFILKRKSFTCISIKYKTIVRYTKTKTIRFDSFTYQCKIFELGAESLPTCCTIDLILYNINA